MAQIKGRFAPSPSGRMHLGNVFCALLAWLSVRSQNGSLLLRIEDLDPARCRISYAEQLEDDLRWLGLPWDEGGLHAAGPHAPYCQSQRSAIYERVLTQLAEQEQLYPCFCSRDELHAASAPHRSDGRLLYSGCCRSLTKTQQAVLLENRRPALRIVAPDEVFSFTDKNGCLFSENLHGDCGDFIIRRSDGVFAYQLAVVIDDALMGVTEVVRGRDLLDSTPRQLFLYRALGFEPPEFGHLPLLLSPDGRRLSKRDRDMDMGVLRQRFTAPVLLGRLAFLVGLIDRPEPATAQELVAHFSWKSMPNKDITVSPSLFPPEYSP
ncbi:tRNA glutamyl-Q(34) synthetase GluQRS [Oscillospiraceae bacterium LTW-04]|nr:tRNA glutamyl-Q(34) synthetase GluQRS [Oscillospiraceae bacterium MB24-C1]